MAAPTSQPKTAAPKRLTWARLVQLEPRMGQLLREARAVRGDDPHYCANACWYGYGRYDGLGLKRRVVALVGWGVTRRGGHPELATREAYDLGYETVYDALPPCRACWCL